MKVSTNIMDAVSVLKNGGVAVIPTDTLYGIVANANNTAAVEKIYSLKKRDTNKAMVVLVSSTKDLKDFGILILKDSMEKTFLSMYWPGPVTAILNIPKEFQKQWKHVHRGCKSVAFRIPKDKKLRELLLKTGPLVAPSANLQEEKPAKTVRQAREFFCDEVDLYVDSGQRKGNPSQLWDLTKQPFKQLR